MYKGRQGQNFELHYSRNRNYHEKGAPEWFSSFLDTTPKNASIRIVTCKKCSKHLLEGFVVEQTKVDYEVIFYYLFLEPQHHYRECTFCEVTNGEDVELLRRELCESIETIPRLWGVPTPDIRRKDNQPIVCANDTDSISGRTKRPRTSTKPISPSKRQPSPSPSVEEWQQDTSQTAPVSVSNASPANMAHPNRKQSIRRRKRQREKQRAESSTLSDLSSSSNPSSSSVAPASTLVVKALVSQERRREPSSSIPPRPLSRAESRPSSANPRSSSQASGSQLNSQNGRPQNTPVCIDIPDSPEAPSADLPETDPGNSIVNVLNGLRSGLGDKAGNALSDIGITRTDHLRLFSGEGRTLLQPFVTRMDGLSPLVLGQLICALDQWLQTHTFAPLDVMPLDDMSECLNGFLQGLGDDAAVVDFVTVLGFLESKAFVTLDSEVFGIVKDMTLWKTHRLPPYLKLIFAEVVERDLRRRGV